MKGGAGPRVQNVRTRGSPDTEEPRRQREPGQEHGCPHNRRKETVRRWRIPHAAAVNSFAHREENCTPRAGLLCPAGTPLSCFKGRC